MKFILRLGLALLTGFVSVSTASAQAYGTADTNAPECVSQNLFNRHLTTGCVTHGQH